MESISDYGIVSIGRGVHVGVVSGGSEGGRSVGRGRVTGGVVTVECVCVCMCV